MPLIPVHHIRGHIAANYLAFPELEPPFLALAISGGNTLIVDVKDYTDMEILGATRDDAAGECFDKAARVLGLPYPGGKPMDELAQQSPGGVYHLPRAHVDGADLDMSFSGLKTAVVNLAHNAQQKGETSGPGGPGPRLCPGRQRRAGAPGHGGRAPPGTQDHRGRRRCGRQLRHPGRSAGAPAMRRAARLYRAASEPLRR